MRAFRMGVAMFVALVLFSTSLAAVSARGGHHGAGHEMTIWFANLDGASEAPTPRDTPAMGVALIRMAGDHVDYMIVVVHISNVFAAHIHCGAPGVAGRIGVTLFMGTPGSGPAHGVLVRSSFSAPDEGNGCGWMSIADVASAVAAGNAYVNVHTNDGVDPQNTGPGDFPAGEIRGPLRTAGEDED